MEAGAEPAGCGRVDRGDGGAEAGGDDGVAGWVEGGGGLATEARGSGAGVGRGWDGCGMGGRRGAWGWSWT